MQTRTGLGSIRERNDKTGQMADIVIVGAGIAGIVCARLLADQGCNVLLLEKKQRIGGLCYDYLDKYGIYIHKFGPHIIKSNSKVLSNFLQQFCHLQHVQVMRTAYVGGKYIPIPINLLSINKLYGFRQAKAISEKLTACFGAGSQITLGELLGITDDEILCSFAQDIYQCIYRGYNQKMWNLRPEDISPEVIGRLPISLSAFSPENSDTYQVVPETGYTAMFREMLRHKRITVHTGSARGIEIDSAKRILLYGSPYHGKVIYTAPLDELFHYQYGLLPYRSLNFKYEKADYIPDQERMVVTFPNNYQKTRTTDMALLMNKSNVKYTTLVHEYPADFVVGEKLQPAYPVLTDFSQSLFLKYNLEAQTVKRFFPFGRLAEFKYLAMEDILLAAPRKCMEVINE